MKYVVLILLAISLLIIWGHVESNRDAIMNNCLELGNSVSQCEKLFE